LNSEKTLDFQHRRRPEDVKKVSQVLILYFLIILLDDAIVHQIEIETDLEGRR
jgi:hypothetical protein